MSLVPLLASVVLVLLALNAGALMVIRVLWPLRAPMRTGSSPWTEDGRQFGPPRAPAVTAHRSGPPLSPAARAERWRWAGMLIGMIGAVVVIVASESVRGVLVAAPVFGVGVLGGTLVGELRMPAPAGQVRRAELRVRRTTDYVPRGLGALVSVAMIALVALVTAIANLGLPKVSSGPDQVQTCYVSNDQFGTELWPSAQNTVPGLSVVLVGLVLAGLVLRRVVRRPRSADVVQFDDVSRRRSAEVVTAASGVLVLASFLSIAGAAGLTLRFVAGVCAEPGWGRASALLSGMALAAFLATAWCGAALLLPAARRIGRRSA